MYNLIYEPILLILIYCIPVYLVTIALYWLAWKEFVSTGALMAASIIFATIWVPISYEIWKGLI